MGLKMMGALRRALHDWSSHRAIGRLLEVDDVVLADIGIRSSDVHRALRQPIFRDPSRALKAACRTWCDAPSVTCLSAAPEVRP
jgi:uncharacterized protein YjiS (DUF1127 family)